MINPNKKKVPLYKKVWKVLTRPFRKKKSVPMYGCGKYVEQGMQLESFDTDSKIKANGVYYGSIIVGKDDK